MNIVRKTESLARGKKKYLKQTKKRSNESLLPWNYDDDEDFSAYKLNYRTLTHSTTS